VASAETAVRAAEAALDKARRDHERTELRAPYDGRVRQVHLDLGSFAAIGSPVAEIYSDAPFEVRLPVPLDDTPYLDLESANEVQLSANIGAGAHQWQAPIVRTEAEIDRSSRSIILVARVEADPQNNAEGPKLLQPGLFVQASIGGRPLDQAVALPQRAFAGPDTVIVVRPDDTIDLRPVTVARRQGDLRIVTAGLADGDRVVLSPLAAVVQNMPVRVVNGADPAAAP
jgi:RND family efflux transporter MFP subunit